ncbi:MAG: TldD/PmbA family protein, partial [Chloroflexi bacterium]|nr:TldD/PmbA family protein [Chloroflexota bacterium]
ESTSAELMTVVMSGDGSGYSARLSGNVEDIDPDTVAGEAVGKAQRGRNPRSLEPGDYEVVLEPAAVSDMLDFLAYTGLGAMAVQEGRSFMSGKIGERVMGANVSIWDDPLDAGGIPRPIDYEGIPAQRVELIANGIARSPAYDLRTAAKEGKRSTGHALPAAWGFGPLPRNLFLQPGEASIDDLIHSVKCGLLVTRFWYTRVVHPLTVTMTGMTRDGTFLIENGEIVGPVKNLRFTESYVGALNRVDAISRRTLLARDMFAVNRVPALKISGWKFTGGTEY